MTVPKVATIRRGGSRYYLHPDTRERVPGVTSVLNMLPKPFLQHWAAKLVAEAAVDKLGAVVDLAVKGDRSGAVDYLKRAPQRMTGAAADRGSEVHDISERLFRGEKVGRVHPELQPQVDAIRAFVERFKPDFVALEQTVWSSTHGYAGSFDWLATFTDEDGSTELVLGDTKTTRSGVHPEVALQLTAYSRADYMIGPEGEQQPMPKVDGGAVLWIPGPEEGRPDPPRQLVPVALSDGLFDVFKALLVVHRWDTAMKDEAVGAPHAF